MKNLYLAIVVLCVALALPLNANAGVKSDVVTLTGLVNAGLCAYGDGDWSIANGCDEEFVGWYGTSERKYNDDREEPDCKPKSRFPIESADCNATGSKAEWRHDGLREILDTAHKRLDNDNREGANRQMCKFVNKVEKFYAAGRIDTEGRNALVRPAKKIARRLGVRCTAPAPEVEAEIQAEPSQSSVLSPARRR